MPIHSAAKKSMRQNKKRKEHNRYYKKTTRTLVKKLRTTKNKKEAEKLLPSVISNIDRLAKRNIIHHRKAARWKSQVMKHVNEL